MPTRDRRNHQALTPTRDSSVREATYQKAGDSSLLIPDTQHTHTRHVRYTSQIYIASNQISRRHVCYSTPHKSTCIKSNQLHVCTWYLFLELKGILKRLGLAVRYSSMSRNACTNLIMAISEALPTAFHATTWGDAIQGTGDKVLKKACGQTYMRVGDSLRPSWWEPRK